MKIQQAISPDRTQILSECMQNYDVGLNTDEWLNNIISKYAVVYHDGKISRNNEILNNTIDEEELKLCKKLSLEITNLMGNTEIGMGSNSGDYFKDFYISYSYPNVAAQITPQLIREYFSGTIFPLATITAESLTTNTIWWKEVEQDAEESPAEYFQAWYSMIEWFQSQQEFIDCAFVRIGDAELLEQIPHKNYPEGTIITGCVLPRLVVGLTKNGSLIGLFGFVVHS